MFRKPRENISQDSHETPFKPSTGRPPTPPPSTGNTRSYARPAASVPPVKNNTTPLGQRSSSMLNGTNRNGRSATPGGRSKSKPNHSILNFFKKVDVPLQVKSSGNEDNLDSLFFDDSNGQQQLCETRSPTPEGFFEEVKEAESRFNEINGSVKRRRTGSFTSVMGDKAGQITGGNASSEVIGAGDKNSATDTAGLTTTDSTSKIDACTPPPPDFDRQAVLATKSIVGGRGVKDSDAPLSEASSGRTPKPKAKKGPFMDDSESEDEVEEGNGARSARPENPDIGAHASSYFEDKPPASVANSDDGSRSSGEDLAAPRPNIPTLKKEATSYDEYGFDDIEDFDDEFTDGEEYAARRWMEEQERLEMEWADIQDEDDDVPEVGESSRITPACPVCDASLAGVSDSEASVHVNHCLDGNPTPLPTKSLPSQVELPKKPITSASNQFKRTPRPPKPGQENPFTLGESITGGSAFSKLMSSHAEDAAWATAAAAETAARGKPSYQRTCPFYKILPGFFICVDAFRYGAVKGCQAYFLSHFHSDHYVGLTSTWCHGPIYCSKVTGNLVRQQLRVDPKWVVDLEFEKTVEVPNTNGVKVTMIPANHCPGSSLFLFTKVIGAGKNPKVHRVLHCGDFRACPEHLQHPLLRPDGKDGKTGKSSQQKIDVCYLDTTYLNPKYAFPSQQDVITACGDMCLSLSKDTVDSSDGFESMKRERAGAGMVKFIRHGSTSSLTEASAISASVSMDSTTNNTASIDNHPGVKTRGRLLVVIGTYSIGKERVCLGIARALNSKIYAPAGKMRICACLEDTDLSSRLTSDPHAAQVHMTPLFEIRADTLADYLASLSPHFSRIVGFRPTGWNYRPPGSRSVDAPAVSTVLHSPSWKSAFTMRDLVPQRGSTKQAQCFGVPYSEHSSFRELSMFCCGLRIEKVIPTVNVGSAKSRERMKMWVERWMAERRKNGLFDVAKW